jgi:hypothetical protein
VVGVVALFVTLPIWLAVALAAAGVALAGYAGYRLFEKAPF